MTYSLPWAVVPWEQGTNFTPWKTSSVVIIIRYKLSLFLTKNNAMKTYCGWWYRCMHSLASALDGGEWSASRPGHFTPRKRAPTTPWIGGWVGPRASLDTVAKRKIPSLLRDSNPDHPIVQPLVSRYTLVIVTLDQLPKQVTTSALVTLLMTKKCLDHIASVQDNWLLCLLAVRHSGQLPSVVWTSPGYDSSEH
jgi:hypothetical protein